MTKRGVAHFISIAFNPVFTTLATLYVALAATPNANKQTWLTIFIVLNLIVPIILVSTLMKRGLALDDTLENIRVKRDRLYAIGPLVVIGLLEWWLATRQQVGQPLVATLAATTLLTAVMALISYSWKISHHLTNISATVFASALIYGVPATWLVVVLPIIAWSRLLLQRHTARQIIGGIVLAPAVIIPVFFWYGLL